jgi:hypothetical protein
MQKHPTVSVNASPLPIYNTDHQKHTVPYPQCLLEHLHAMMHSQGIRYTIRNQLSRLSASITQCVDPAMSDNITQPWCKPDPSLRR